MQLSPLYMKQLAAAKAEGESIGGARTIVRILSRRLREIPPQYSTQIQQLAVLQLEDLGEALLDFTTFADLDSWLSTVKDLSKNTFELPTPAEDLQRRQQVNEWMKDFRQHQADLATTPDADRSFEVFAKIVDAERPSGQKLYSAE